MNNRERLLIRSSNNITNLLSIIKLHEENIASYNRNSEFDINLFSLSIPLSYLNTSSVDVSDIQQFTTDTKFCEIVNPMNSECPITQDVFQPTDQVLMINTCRHIFKKTSLMSWLNRNRTCPCCRIAIN
jgi:hypothetical protein